jgi:elongation factor G
LQGATAGFPMQDIRVTVYDGKTHSVDGKEIAFVIAAKKAFQVAIREARPILLEPMVKIELTVPEAHFGDVSGDLSVRRGQITGSQGGRSGMMQIDAIAPLAELDNLQSRLKALTGGQGSYTLALSHYEPAPGDVQHRLSEQFKPVEDEE